MEQEKEKERFPIRVSSAVLIQDKGKLLLVQQATQKKGFKWGLPAGKVESFEDPKKVAVRETKEETGLEVELVDLVGIYPVSRGTQATSYGFVFRGKVKTGKIRPAKGEIRDCQYFSLEEIDNLRERGKIYRPEYNIRAIEDWKNGSSYPLDVIKSITL